MKFRDKKGFFDDLKATEMVVAVLRDRHRARQKQTRRHLPMF
jgi:hypothetical protein